MPDEFRFALTDWAPRHHHGIPSSSCAGRLVDVWVCSLRTDACLDVSSRWLSAAERRRLGRFVRARDRLRFAVSHSLMRAILGHYLGTSPEHLRLREEALGKPYVLDRTGARSAWNFNLSHCEDRALVAVAQSRRIGVDIERESGDVDLAAVVRRFFSPAERRQFASQPRDERRAWFYRQWVAKEAVLKTHGGGLSVAPESFSVVFCEPGIATVVSPDAEPGDEWIVRTLDVGPGWHAAVASSGRDWELEVMMPVERPEA
jgi:4'-phosphopantetheinyl transferase